MRQIAHEAAETPEVVQHAPHTTEYKRLDDVAAVAPAALRHRLLLNFEGQAQGISPDEARRQREATIPTRTYGRAEDFGAACAFLCSQQARFIVGQNLVLDGGALNVTV